MQEILDETQKQIASFPETVAMLQLDLQAIQVAYHTLRAACEQAIKLRDLCLVQGSQETIIQLCDRLEESLILAEMEASHVTDKEITSGQVTCSKCDRSLSLEEEELGYCVRCTWGNDEVRSR